jgi:hypothetical protein
MPEAASDPIALFGEAMDLARPPAWRAGALDRLGRVADLRVLPALRYLLLDRVPEVRRSATRAIGQLHDPSALAALLEGIRDSRLSFDVREEAVRQIGVQGLPTAADRLLEVLNDKRMPTSLTKIARAEIAARFPQRLPEEAAPVAKRVPPSGRPLLSATGAAYGSYTLFAVGELGQSDVGPALGLLGGAVLGGAAGYLVSESFTRNRSLALATGIGLGLWTGVGTGFGIFGPNADSRIVNAFAVGGEIAGLVVTHLSWESLQPRLEVENPLGGELQLAVGAAMLGGAGLHLVGRLSSSGTVQNLGLLSGVAYGGAMGNLIGQRTTPGQGAFMTTGIGWGLATGMLAGAAVLPQHADSRLVELSGLAGGIGGLVATGLLWDDQVRMGDVTLINLAGLTGSALAGGGVLLATPTGDVRPALGILAGGSVAGLVAGGLLAPQLTFSAGDRGLAALFAAHGAVAGVTIPGIVTPVQVSGTDRLAGFLLGTAGGLIGGSALAQATEYASPDVGVMFTTDFLGTLGGLGAGLLASRNNDASIAPNAGALLGGALGLSVAAAMARELSFSKGDLLLSAGLSGLGLWQGIGLSVGLSGTGTQVGGAALLGVGAFGLAGMAISQEVDVPATAVAAASTGLLWGAWLSAFATGLVPDMRTRDRMLIVLGASDAGLALSAILVSPLVGVSPVKIGVASLGGLAGAVFGTLGTALATSDTNTLIIANLTGTSLGLVGGAVVASVLDLGGSPETPHGAAGSSASALPGLTFRGFSTQPILRPDGRIDGVAVAAMLETP